MMRYTISLLLATVATTPAFAEVPKVVTDFAPVHALVAQVMGDLGAPSVLLEQGADPHSFQLRPSQAATLQEADLIIWIGPELTPWLDRALDGTATQAGQLQLLSTAGTFTRSYGADHDDHAHEEHHVGSPSGTGAETPENIDPHAWLDPVNARHWLDVIATALGEKDPANAAAYSANADFAAAGIMAMDAEVRAILAPVKDKPFVVYHDAYAYFVGHYGLTMAGTIALGDAAEPGAESLSDLRQKMEASAAICIFPETGHDPKLAAQLVDGTAVRLGPALDPEGITLMPSPTLYTDLMRGMATSLAACLTR